MTSREASNEIKRLIDELQRAKTCQEKKGILKQIKPFMEIIEAPIKKMKKEEEAQKAKKRVLKNALKELLGTLDKISGKRLGLGRDVCEEMREVIHHCFIKPQRQYSWPARFGMGTAAEEAGVRAALQKFLTHPEVVAASRSLKSPEDRLLAFQDHEVITRQDSTISDYFGFLSTPLSCEEVERIKRETQN